MAMLTKTQLIKAFNAGDLEGVTKELRRYGKIIRDVSWDCPDGFYAGANRSFHVEYKGLIWQFLMINGDVSRLSCTVKFKD